MSWLAQWKEKLTTLGAPAAWGRPAQMAAVCAVIAVCAAAILWSRGPDFRTLFTNLEDRDGGAIVAALGQMNVPYRFSENGRAIMVPQDRVHELRLALAQQGLPRSGTAGFELLDQPRFGASQFTEQLTYQRALEGELANSIKSLHAVQAARVHLALPRESLFVRDRQAPTASVLLTLHPGRSLGEAQVHAIAWLVSSSVPHLNAAAVSVVDQDGRLLTSPSGEAGAQSTRRSLVNDVEQRTVQRILTLLNPLVGPGNVRAQVTADIDFSQHEQTSEVYKPNQDPGQGAVRSKQTSNSMQRGLLPPEGVPGALTNQPPLNATAPIQASPVTGPAREEAAQGTVAALAPGAPSDAAQRPDGSRRDDATVNYEVDRTMSHLKSPAGTVRRLSVAVVLNYRQTDEGATPLQDREMQQIGEIVRQAMGYSAARGDSLSVVNTRFNDSAGDQPPFWENPLYLDYGIRLVQYLLIALLAWLLWRLANKHLLARDAAARAASAGEDAAQQRSRAQSEAAERLAGEVNRYEDNLRTARDMALKDPRAVAMVLRSWMEKKDESR